MQRILLSLCTGTLLLFVQPKAQAQEQHPPPSFEKNLIGGSVAFGYSSTFPEYTLSGLKATATSYSFAPTYAYYFKEHVAIGATLAYNFYKQTNYNDTDETRSNTYYFGPFIRFEIPLWQSRFSIYNDLGIYCSFNRNTIEDEGYSGTFKGGGGGAYYEPGIMFRIKSNVALQASIGQLLSYAYAENGGSYSHSFGIRSNHNGTNDVKFGFNFLF